MPKVVVMKTAKHIKKIAPKKVIANPAGPRELGCIPQGR
jgi:hypothetical protein